MSACRCSSQPLETFAAAVDAPVACTIEKREVKARERDFRDAFASLVAKQRTSDGFRWVFRDEPGLAAKLRALAAREHACCQFLTFVIARAGTQLVWEVRAPEGAEAASEVFFALPETLQHGGEALTLAAQRAGLPLTHASFASASARTRE